MHLVQTQRPERGVNDVRAHVADRAVAVADPGVPVVRMERAVVFRGRVVVAHGRGTAPEVPVHPLWRGRLGRTVRHRVQLVVERPHLAYLSQRAALHVFHKTAVSFAAVSVVAHLRHHAVLARRLEHELGLLDGKRHRLLNIDVQSLLHGKNRGKRVVVVRRGDHDGIQLSRHLVQHLVVVVERAYLRNVRLRLMRLHDRAHLAPVA